jgi:hypothetical protein
MVRALRATGLVRTVLLWQDPEVAIMDIVSGVSSTTAVAERGAGRATLDKRERS